MKNSQVINAFIHGETAHSSTGNLRSTGDQLINYSTVLAFRDHNGINVNIRRYTNTTSKIQSLIRSELSTMRIKFITYEDMGSWTKQVGRI